MAFLPVASSISYRPVTPMGIAGWLMYLVTLSDFLVKTFRHT
jgi:hypothetical protein